MVFFCNEYGADRRPGSAQNHLQVRMVFVERRLRSESMAERGESRDLGLPRRRMVIELVARAHMRPSRRRAGVLQRFGHQNDLVVVDGLGWIDEIVEVTIVVLRPVDRITSEVTD